MLCLCLLSASAGSAAESAADPGTGAYQDTYSPDPALIRQKLESLTTDQAVDDPEQKQKQSLYESALADLQSASGFKAQTAFYREAAQMSVSEIDKNRHSIEKLQKEAERLAPRQFRKFGTNRLEQTLIDTRTRLESLKNQLEDIGSQSRRQLMRPVQIRADHLKIEEKRNDLDKQLLRLLQSPSPEDTLIRAQATALRSKQMALESELDSLEMELSSHSALRQLLRSRYDLAIARVALARSELEVLEQTADHRRISHARKLSSQLDAALEGAADKPGILRETIRQNSTLANELAHTSGRISEVRNRQADLARQTERIRNELKVAEKKIHLSTLTPAFSTMLREQRRLLINEDASGELNRQLSEQIELASLRVFEIEDDLNSLADTEAVAKKKLGATPADAKNSQQLTLKVELAYLLDEQRELLERLESVYSDYLQNLGALELSAQNLTRVSTRFSDFLDTHLLQVRSAPPVDAHFPQQVWISLQWIASADLWLRALEDGRAALQKHPYVTLIFILAIFLLGLFRRSMGERMATLSARVTDSRTDRLSYTFEAFAYCVLMALPVPAMLVFGGWILTTGASESEFSSALGKGFLAAAVPLLSLQTFRYVFMHGGIAEYHLRWTDRSVSLIRQQIRWIRYVAGLGMFVIGLTRQLNVVAYGDSLGRLCLIVMMLCFLTALAIVLNPSHGTLKRYLVNHPRSLTAMTRYLWYPLVLLVPLAISGFAATGYLATAMSLELRMVATIRIVFISILVYEIALRALRLFNRKHAHSDPTQGPQTATGSAGDSKAASRSVLRPADRIDLSTINSQARQLMLALIMICASVLLWWVWQDLFPALDVLNDWVLWQTSTLSGNGLTTTPVTVANALIALLYIALAVIAAKNLRGVLEVLVLNRTAIDPGIRFAINQLTRYFLIALTVVLVVTELGGRWSQLQWLVAALSVGLGFGLQEIFANFISGIILLFERPIRIGDTVTIDGVTGTVSRMQIRATTITDWDRKDLVVPNKAFITDQLVNWTRSDNITRILIPVGIAYGSDTDRVHALLGEILACHPAVLDEPPPTVYFSKFGDSALEFEIRLFARNIGDRLPLIHDLHMSINRAFAENGIEIPFPQRDLHIRNLHGVVTDGLQTGVAQPSEPTATDSTDRGQKNA